MRDLVLRGKGQTATDAPGTTLIVTPDVTAQPGDLIQIGVATNPPGVFPDASVPGFSILRTQDITPWQRLQVLSKIAGAGEPSSYTVTLSVSSDCMSVGILIFQNADQSNPQPTVVSAPDAVSDNTFNIPSITTAYERSFDVVWLSTGGNANNGPSADFMLSAIGSGLAIGVNWGITFCGVAGAYAVRAAPGVQAATTATSFIADTSAAIRIEVKKAGAAALYDRGWV